MKINYLLSIWIVGLGMICSACFDDKGNYDYSPVNSLTLEVPEEISVLANADTIRVIPRVISALEGEILPDNPHYAYRYLAAPTTVSGAEGTMIMLDSAVNRDLVIPAKLIPGKYNCWLEVTDLRTEVATSAKFILNVSSVTTEGWMVLCEEGEEKRVRLDMIARISDERYIPTYDILANYLPDLHEAYSLKFFTDKYNIDEYVYLLTGSGCYRLDPEYLTSGPEYSMEYEFARQEEQRIPLCMEISYGYRVIVDRQKDAYAMENTSGAIYESAVNHEQNTPDKRFELAPFVGTDRKAAGNKCTTAVLFDQEKGRFIQWTENVLDACFPIPDPEGALFSYTTGKKLVYMESVLNSNTVVYAILKDESNKFWLYGISMSFSWSGTIYKQHYYGEIEATAFDRATSFAFHSKLPYLFYAVGNQLYQYDIYQKKTFPMFSLEEENITMLKFNLFTKDYFYSNRPADYLSIPDNLIVATEDLTAQDENKGILRFYRIPALNGQPELIGEPYRKLGKIRDVVYRER